jgi:hypothetical protein
MTMNIVLHAWLSIRPLENVSDAMASGRAGPVLQPRVVRVSPAKDPDGDELDAETARLMDEKK